MGMTTDGLSYWQADWAINLPEETNWTSTI